MVSRTFSAREARVPMPWARSGASMICATVCRRFSAENGSWNTICMRLRSRRSSSPRRSCGRCPSKTTDPPSMPPSASTAFDTVDLPEPDSPTSPTVSPRRIWNDTSSTAVTRRPEPSVNTFDTPCTSTSTSPDSRARSTALIDPASASGSVPRSSTSAAVRMGCCTSTVRSTTAPRSAWVYGCSGVA